MPASFRVALRWSKPLCLILMAANTPVIGRAADEDDTKRLTTALSYKPRQAFTAYDQVERADFEQCSIEEISRPDGKGFSVTGPAGQALRWFADTNKDNRIDQWSYFKDGLEVYRESDTDADGVADEYRWLSTAGLRKGVDEDKDGQIDVWLQISAEEVTAEVVAATASRDPEQFQRLLVTQKEIDDLGLGEAKESELRQSVKDARAQFEAWTAGQNVVTRTSKWTNFGADKPGVVPAGTDNSTKDVVVYENTVALIDNEGEARQLLVGTMVKVGDAWRLIGLPKAISEGAVVSDGSVFFSVAFNANSAAEPEPTAGISKIMEKLVGDLQDVDAKLVEADGDLGVLQARRADVLEKLVSESTGDRDRSLWIRQFADTVSAAAQTGEYPDGVKRLDDFAGKLKRIHAPKDDMAYVVFRTLTADHNQKMQAPKADYDKLQEAYLDNLGTFVRSYPQSPDAAEAMIQLALSAELLGELKDAENWYTKASRGFQDLPAGRKAAGALRRLNLEGKSFGFTATRLDGGQFNSNAYQGSPVIYHGWASWCGTCKAEMRALKELQAKYARTKLKIVGINFDSEARTGQQFLKENPFPWTHVWEKEGLEGELATSYGFLSLPVNIIVDGSGKVVATGVHWTELDDVLSDILKR